LPFFQNKDVQDEDTVHSAPQKKQPVVGEGKQELRSGTEVTHSSYDKEIKTII
jgi:hypothetical protein